MPSHVAFDINMFVFYVKIAFVVYSYLYTEKIWKHSKIFIFQRQQLTTVIQHSCPANVFGKKSDFLSLAFKSMMCQCLSELSQGWNIIIMVLCAPWMIAVKGNESSLQHFMPGVLNICFPFNGMNWILTSVLDEPWGCLTDYVHTWF